MFSGGRSNNNIPAQLGVMQDESQLSNFSDVGPESELSNFSSMLSTTDSLMMAGGMYQSPANPTLDDLSLPAGYVSSAAADQAEYDQLNEQTLSLSLNPAKRVVNPARTPFSAVETSTIPTGTLANSPTAMYASSPAAVYAPSQFSSTTPTAVSAPGPNMLSGAGPISATSPTVMSAASPAGIKNMEIPIGALAAIPTVISSASPFGMSASSIPTSPAGMSASSLPTSPIPMSASSMVPSPMGMYSTPVAPSSDSVPVTPIATHISESSVATRSPESIVKGIPTSF